MNKFLEICFKIGKSILFILIILCFLCIIGSAISIPQTFKKIEVVKPSFTQLFAQSQPIKTNEITSINELYRTEFQNMSKKYFTEIGKQIVWERLQTINPEYRLQYIQGLESAIKDLGDFAKKEKLTDYGFNNLFEELLNNYDVEFRTNITIKETKEAQQQIQRWFDFGCICSSILLFILFLCIALLIKIEENTRK